MVQNKNKTMASYKKTRLTVVEESAEKSFVVVQQLLANRDNECLKELAKENKLENKYYKSLLRSVEKIKEIEEKNQHVIIQRSKQEKVESNDNLDILRNVNSWYVDFEPIQEEQDVLMKRNCVGSLQEKYVPSYPEDCLEMLQHMSRQHRIDRNYNAVRRHRESVPHTKAAGGTLQEILTLNHTKSNDECVENNFLSTSTPNPNKIAPSNLRIDVSSSMSRLHRNKQGINTNQPREIVPSNIHHTDNTPSTTDIYNRNLDGTLLQNHLQTLLSYLMVTTNFNKYKHDDNKNCPNHENYSSVIDVSCSLQRVVNNTTTKNDKRMLNRYQHQYSKSTTVIPLATKFLSKQEEEDHQKQQQQYVIASKTNKKKDTKILFPYIVDSLSYPTKSNTSSDDTIVANNHPFSPNIITAATRTTTTNSKIYKISCSSFKLLNKKSTANIQKKTKSLFKSSWNIQKKVSLSYFKKKRGRYSSGSILGRSEQ